MVRDEVLGSRVAKAGKSKLTVRDIQRLSGVAQAERDEIDDLFLDAFSFLCGCRNWGMGGPTPIPLSEYVAYQVLWHDEMHTDFINILMGMDAAYIAASSELREPQDG